MIKESQTLRNTQLFKEALNYKYAEKLINYNSDSFFVRYRRDKNYKAQNKFLKMLKKRTQDYRNKEYREKKAKNFKPLNFKRPQMEWRLIILKPILQKIQV